MCGPYVHTKESLIMSTLTTGTYEKYGASYKTLTLTDGEYAFTVTPEKGGMATSFTKNGDEYLWLRDKNFESTDRPRLRHPHPVPELRQTGRRRAPLQRRGYPSSPRPGRPRAVAGQERGRHRH